VWSDYVAGRKVGEVSQKKTTAPSESLIGVQGTTEQKSGKRKGKGKWRQGGSKSTKRQTRCLQRGRDGTADFGSTDPSGGKGRPTGDPVRREEGSSTGGVKKEESQKETRYEEKSKRCDVRDTLLRKRERQEREGRNFQFHLARIEQSGLFKLHQRRVSRGQKRNLSRGETILNQQELPGAKLPKRPRKPRHLH